MLRLDLTHTSHSQARSGIQRVARALHTELAARGAALAVTWDPYARVWRPLEGWEFANLAQTTPGTRRGARWPLIVRLRGLLRRRLGRASAFPLSALRSPLSDSGLLEPEIFSPAVAAALPTLFAHTPGPCVALFHDAIALKFPELAAPKTVALSCPVPSATSIATQRSWGG